MFFIFGISPVKKSIEYVKTVVCTACGKYGRYEVYMTYMCFSIFFLPIIKWNKHYYVETTCCNTLYELNEVVGKRLKNGENIEIKESDLTLIDSGNTNGWGNSNYTSEKRCICCGYVASADYKFCPKCGGKL